jgi:cytochrome c-type biogenesis protein CcmF
MITLGHTVLVFAWLLSLSSLCYSVYVARRPAHAKYMLLQSSSNLACLATIISVFILALLFLQDDYRLQVVWQFSNHDMPAIYKVTAIWGGMAGSMLLWCAMLAGSVYLVGRKFFTIPETLAPWVLGVLQTSLLFFLTVTVFFTNPFAYINSDFLPAEGNGLNPLLQNPYMAVHPPLLYLGFTTMAVPYAFCMAALLAGRLDNEWILLTRRWSLIAWGFLTAGICLGGYWAYIELGWGGFWAWDPVENASFFPWLTATAFLHSVMVQERKNMLKLWNISLVTLSYALTVFGTFLTRSGIVQSVHAFASTDIGWVFLVYLAFIIGLALLLCIYRRKELASAHGIESFWSRESAFLLNNLLLLTICFATIWGVMFPVLSEAVTGTKQAVSIPYFNAVNVPIFIALIVLMGIGPMLSWKNTSPKQVFSLFWKPALIGIFSGAALMFSGIESFAATLSYAACAFVLSTIIAEFYRGAKRAKLERKGNKNLEEPLPYFYRHARRYTAHIVHLGVIIASIGITASMAHKVEVDFALAVGASVQKHGLRIELQGLEEVERDNHIALKSQVKIFQDKKGSPVFTTLSPELRSYLRGRESTSEVAIHHSLSRDIYLVLAGLDDSNEKAAFKLYINPLQVWLWIGVGIMLLGVMVLIGLASGRKLSKEYISK